MADTAWSHLPQPFQPGAVIPSNRSGEREEYHYTFRCAAGETYHYRVQDFALAADAELAMRQFCARHGNGALARYQEQQSSGRNFLSGALTPAQVEADREARGRVVR